jgi:hypothetical protein
LDKKNAGDAIRAFHWFTAVEMLVDSMSRIIPAVLGIHTDVQVFKQLLGFPAGPHVTASTVDQPLR